jgi:hypothetical protein
MISASGKKNRLRMKFGHYSSRAYLARHLRPTEGPCSMNSGMRPNTTIPTSPCSSASSFNIPVLYADEIGERAEPHYDHDRG